MAKVANRLIATGLVLALGCGGSGKAQAPARDAGGAGAKQAGAPSVPADLCSLLTEAEAEAILGKELEPPRRQSGGDCWYGERLDAGPDLVLSILPVSLPSRSAFDAFMKEQVEDINAKMRQIGAKESTLEPVPELGDPAYYVDGLFVFRKNRVLVIGTERPQAIAIAAKALPRWK